MTRALRLAGDTCLSGCVWDRLVQGQLPRSGAIAARPPKPLWGQGEERGIPESLNGRGQLVPGQGHRGQLGLPECPPRALPP